MENPFTNGQVKNYLLFYASIVLIMILFFVATSLFHDVEEQNKKVFNTEIIEKNSTIKEKSETIYKMKFKLMESSY